MNLPIRCMAASCGHRFERTASEVLANGTCPACGSTDIDADDEGFAPTAAKDETKWCRRCGSVEATMPNGMCGFCHNRTGGVYDGPDQSKERKSGSLPAEPAAMAMDPASEVNQETARCAFCMKTYAYRSADPTEPVPACPHCGSTATTPAGAAGMHTASGEHATCTVCGRSAVNTLTHGWMHEDPRGRGVDWALQDDIRRGEDHPVQVAGDHTALLLRTASKIEEIARSVIASNPGMTTRDAVTIANETVRRYPRVVEHGVR